MIQTKQTIIKEAGFMATLVDDLLREGRTVEAREMVTGELQTVSEINELLRLKNLLCKIERADKDFHSALKIHLDAYPIAQLSDNHTLRARFHIELAITYEELSQFDKALIEYQEAKFHYQEDGNREEIGLIENNTAFLLSKLDRFDEAFQYLEKARGCFSDPVRLAEISVTEAQIYLRMGEAEKALDLMLECQRIFRKHGAKALFNDSIPTLIKAAVDYQVRF